jgi:phage shock protein PspC (stress-responsive transcriptional regulator)
MSSEGEQPDRQRQPVRTVRPREGRLVGGVCAGLPDLWGLGTSGVRLLFAVAGLLGGLGVVAYLACWLVIPAEDQDPDADPVRSVVLLAWATGGLMALVLVAAGAAAATVFGLGWVVFALAASVAALSFSPLRTLSPLRTRIPTLAAVLTLGALTLPAVAVALSPLRLSFQSGALLAQPQTYRAVDRTVYRSGFGTLLIDLRRTPPPGGSATLRIDAGLRRTIVALPTDGCVRVRVNYDIHLFPAHFAALLTGRSETEFHDVVLFGQAYGYGAAGGTRGTAVNGVNVGKGPLLTIDFTSQGGGLYVRDYPGRVDPDLAPQWPGYEVPPEPRPILGNEPRKVRTRILRAWRQRRAAQRASQEQIRREMPGPCAA